MQRVCWQMKKSHGRSLFSGRIISRIKIYAISDVYKRQIIIYALMAFFVGCGFYHIVNLSKYQKDFALIGKRIKTDAQAVIDLQEYLEGTTSEQNKLFQSDKLNAKLEEYRAAYQRTKSTSFAAPFVDITDFFNGEFLDELGHTGFCELVPGTMTGLGILGTFVGLVLGVGGFDTSTTDAVMVSITHLLGCLLYTSRCV